MAAQMAVVSVTSAGTAVRFTATPTPIRRLTIFSPLSNAGPYQYVGGSDVSSAVYGAALPQDGGGPVVIDFAPGTGDLSDFYVDADTSADAISYVAVLV